MQHTELDLPEYSLDERLADAESVWTGLQPQKQERRIRPLLLRITAAASVLIALSVGGYYTFKHKQQIIQIAKNQIDDIAPGSNKAILTLANGSKFLLLMLKMEP